MTEDDIFRFIARDREWEAPARRQRGERLALRLMIAGSILILAVAVLVWLR